MVMGSGFVQQPRHLIVTVLLIGTSPGHHVRRRIAPSEVMEDSPEGLDTDAKGGSDSEKPERGYRHQACCQNQILQRKCL
jgi:hypothetical protein